MKRILPILAGAACLCSAASAQQSDVQPLTTPRAPMASLAQFFAEPAWQRAFAYNLTPLESVEPKITPEEGTFLQQQVAPLLQAENYRGALDLLVRTYIQGRPETVQVNPVVLFTAGALSQQLGNTTTDAAQANTYLLQAERYLLRATQGFPNYQRAHRSLGQLYMQLSGNASGEQVREYTSKAIPHLQRALSLGAQEAATYTLLGYAYVQNENYFSSEAALKSALMFDPQSENIRLLLAQTLLFQSRYREARALFEELILSKPDKADWWLQLANTYIPDNNTEKAAQILELVRQMGGSTFDSNILLGNIYVTRETYDIAGDVFASAVQQANAQPGPLVDAARTLVGYSAFAEATKLIDAIQARFPEMARKDQLDLLTLESQIAIANDRGDEAARILEQILAQDPQNGGALNTLGSYYGQMIEVRDNGQSIYRPRDLQRAVFYLERAQDHQDTDVRLRSYLTHAQLLVREQDTQSLRRAGSLLQRAQAIRQQDFVQRYIQQLQDNLAARTARG